MGGVTKRWAITLPGGRTCITWAATREAAAAKVLKCRGVVAVAVVPSYTDMLEDAQRRQR